MPLYNNHLPLFLKRKINIKFINQYHKICNFDLSRHLDDCAQVSQSAGKQARSRPYNYYGRCQKFLCNLYNNNRVLGQILVIVPLDWAQYEQAPIWDKIVYHFSYFRELWTLESNTFKQSICFLKNKINQRSWDKYMYSLIDCHFRLVVYYMFIYLPI